MDYSDILHLCGIAGIVGALLTAAGDLLYQHIPGSKENLAGKMVSLPMGRLVLAGTLGVVGSWLYLLGAFHLHFAFLALGIYFAWGVTIAFALVAICFGAAHAAFFAIGSSAKVARQYGGDIETSGKMGNALFDRLVLLTYVPVVIASVMMLYGILSGHSPYPRWMALFSPIVLYLLRIPLLRMLRGRATELIHDCADNLVLLIYFIASTFVLWGS